MEIVFAIAAYIVVGLFLFLPMWYITRRMGRRLRIFIRASVMAIAFAPGLFISPGGEFGTLFPALLVILFYWSERDFWIETAFVSIFATGAVALLLLVWLDRPRGNHEDAQE